MSSQPQPSPQGGRPPAKTVPLGQDRSKKVLLVDSDDEYRASMTTELQQQLSGIDIKQAANGQEALYVMERFTVDLLVTELNMPVMDGFELLNFLRQQNLRVPVMVITDSPLADIQDILRSLGYYMFHQKSAEKSSLIDRIKDALLSEVEGSLHGVSVAGFLQLLESERKNCILSVMHNGRRGQIHVVDGAVIDAQTEKMRGEDAAKEIVCWGNVQMFISQGSRFGRNTVKLKLQDLLLQAFVRQDEAAEKERQARAGK